MRNLLYVLTLVFILSSCKVMTPHKEQILDSATGSAVSTDGDTATSDLICIRDVDLNGIINCKDLEALLVLGDMAAANEFSALLKEKFEIYCDRVVPPRSLVVLGDCNAERLTGFDCKDKVALEKAIEATDRGVAAGEYLIEACDLSKNGKIDADDYKLFMSEDPKLQYCNLDGNGDGGLDCKDILAYIELGKFEEAEKLKNTLAEQFSVKCEITKGDCNADGAVNCLDVDAMNKVLNGDEKPTPGMIYFCDLNGNGTPDKEDLENLIYKLNPALGLEYCPLDANGDGVLQCNDVDVLTSAGRTEESNKLRDVLSKLFGINCSINITIPSTRIMKSL